MRRTAPGVLLSLFVLAGVACSSGKNDGPCGAGQVLCGGCYEPARYQTDVNNCGGCGIACGPAGSCVAGQCVCGTGTTRCDALVPRCRDLQADDGACGSCATACNVLEVGWTCQAGACGCFGDRVECGTVCTDTANDPNNCGAGVAGCGFACKTKALCVSGVCECPPDLPDECATACTNLQNDPANCGACGTACLAAGELCSGASCQCPPLLPDRCPATGEPAACVNETADRQNCGSCGHACSTGATCTSGSCVCPPGQIDTGGACHCPTGPATGCNGQCCDGGTACCGNGACQTKHSNGLGQFYFDCNPLFAPAQTTAQAAAAAAAAWPPGAGGTTIQGACQPFCIGVQTATATQCAVWCYAGSTFQGLVGLNTANGACLCPTVAATTQSWN